MHIATSPTYGHSQKTAEVTANQITSGKRITSAAVDPSGLAIATGLITQADSFDQGASNAQAAINASNVADGAIATISDSAQRLQTLSVAANNDLLSSSDRANLQTEADQNAHEINSVAGNTQYNGVALLNGSSTSLNFQTGSNEGNTTALSLPSSGAGALGVSSIDLSSSSSAQNSEYATDAAVSTLASSAAQLGSQTVALKLNAQNSQTASSNLSAAASSTADADATKVAADAANQKTAAQHQIDLQVQANLAASGVVSLFYRH